MRTGQAVVVANVVVVAVLAVVSGPLVPVVDLSQSPPGPGSPPGVGTADVTVTGVPDRIVLQRSAFGAGTYHLENADSTVAVAAAEGNPYVEYRVEIPALEETRVRAFGLHGRAGETVRMRFGAYEIQPGVVHNDTYEGRVEISLQSDDYAILRQRPVTVEVRGR
jgi:hypothetical protein